MVTINYRNYHFITIRHLQGTAQVDIWIFVQKNPNISGGCIWTKIDNNVHHQHWGVTDEDCFPIWKYGRDLCLLWQGGWIFIILEFVAIEVLNCKTIFKQKIASEELLSYKWNGEITQEDKQVNTILSQSSKLVWEWETQFDRSFIHSRCEEGQRIFQTNIMRTADILSDWLIANITSWSQ